jgi:uncharacterized protein with FMN-binding domain
VKRLVVSAVVVAAFAFYAIFSRGELPVQTANTVDIVASASSTESTTTQSSDTQSTTSQSQTTTSQNDTTTSTASGLYADGTYTGSEADAMYGIVQVQVVVDGGQITDIQFLSTPSGRRESEEINGFAAPILAQEAIAAQSAKVQAVSGATLTSHAFVESLQSALEQAQA